MTDRERAIEVYEQVMSASNYAEELHYLLQAFATVRRETWEEIERMVRKQLQQPDLYRVTHVLIRDILAELQAIRTGGVTRWMR